MKIRQKNLQSSAVIKKVIDVWKKHYVSGKLKMDVYRKMCEELEAKKNISLTPIELVYILRNLKQKFRYEKKNNSKNWKYYKCLSKIFKDKNKSSLTLRNKNQGSSINVGDNGISNLNKNHNVSEALSSHGTVTPIMDTKITPIMEAKLEDNKNQIKTSIKFDKNQKARSIARSQRIQERFLDMAEKEDKIFVKYMQKSIENTDKMFILLRENNRLLEMLLHDSY